MFFFIIYFKPFQEDALTYSNALSEIGLAGIIILISFYLFDLSENNQNRLDLVLMIFINLVIGSQMCASFYITFKTIRLKIKNRNIVPILPENKMGLKGKEMIIFIQPEESIERAKDKDDDHTDFIFSYDKIIQNTPCESINRSYSDKDQSHIEDIIGKLKI